MIMKAARRLKRKAFMLQRKQRNIFSKHYNTPINSMESLTKRNNFIYFFYPVFLFWIAGGILLYMKGYKGSFLLLNSHYSSILDTPLYLLTHLGNGLMIIAILMLLWSKDKLDVLLCVIIGVIISGIIVQLFKNYLFDKWARPQLVFEGQLLNIHTYPHYRIIDNSFPSGHSNTIAGVFTIIAYAYRNRTKAFITLISLFTLLICYTRIYLGVHFLGDVLAGSFLGISVSLLTLKFLHLPSKEL